MSDTNWKLPWNGRCRCGAVHIRVNAAPLMTSVCHCTGCQKMSSSAYSLTVMVPAPAFEVVEGEVVQGGMRADDARHMFCDHCKTWIFTKIEAYGVVNVRTTMLDDAGWAAPFLESYTSTKLPWVETPATHRFAEFPPPSAFEPLIAEFQEKGPRP